ncbi:hypothetical protein J6590_043668 [Homalodisca vitripennis]|nr:hypothetical protein J6590_043668 [Homalodisca vitripennis]
MSQSVGTDNAPTRVNHDIELCAAEMRTGTKATGGSYIGTCASVSMPKRPYSILLLKKSEKTSLKLEQNSAKHLTLNYTGFICASYFLIDV